MREEIVEALVALRALRVNPEDEFDQLALMGQFASLLDAQAELGEALLRWNRVTNNSAREE